MKLFWSTWSQRIFTGNGSVLNPVYAYLDETLTPFSSRYKSFEITNYFKTFSDNEVEMFLMLHPEVDEEYFREEFKILKEGL